jgi:hypothetical protein
LPAYSTRRAPIGCCSSSRLHRLSDWGRHGQGGTGGRLRGERGQPRILELRLVWAGRYGPLQITYACSVVLPLFPDPVPMKFTTHVPVVPPPVG